MHSMGPVKLLQNGERTHRLRSREHRIHKLHGAKKWDFFEGVARGGGGGAPLPPELAGVVKGVSKAIFRGKQGLLKSFKCTSQLRREV